jgi:hypothetical protein
MAGLATPSQERLPRLTACALAALLLAQQFSPPEGPDGLVYNKDWPTRRLATQHQGKWDAWRMHARPGNGGQSDALAPAEAAQVEAVLKAIAQTVESGPYAQAQRGWYAPRFGGLDPDAVPDAAVSAGEVACRELLHALSVSPDGPARHAERRATMGSRLVA